MITITTPGKTYKWKWVHCMMYISDDSFTESHGKNKEILWYKTPDELVKLGYLEEVKPLSQKRAEAIERGKELTDKHDIQAKTHHGTDIDVATSILEKLREDLVRRKRLLTGSINDTETDREKRCISYPAILREIESIERVLTSLETKEEPKISCIHQTWQGWACTICQPQFTPWQMIEVSNDGEKWKVRTFDKILDNSQHNVGTKEWYAYLFARPIEDKIEQVTIPEFTAEKHICTWWTNSPDWYTSLVEHLEKITRFLHSQFPNSKPK